MARKRKKSDSGLRAGFIHEDDAKKITKEEEILEPSEESDIKETDIKEKEDTKKKEKESSSGKDKAKATSKKAEGPKISMQGISGKSITGVVKVVKKVSSPAEKDDDSDSIKEVKTSEDPADKKTTEETQVQKSTPKTDKKARTSVESASDKTKDIEVKDESQVSKKVASKTEKTTAETDKKLSADSKSLEQTSEKEEAKQKAKPKKKVKSKAKESAKKDKTKKDSPGLIVDQGVSVSSFSGPRIRPQRGSYVGKNKEVPAIEQRRARTKSATSSQASSSRRSAPRTDNKRPAAPGRSSGGRNFTQDKDRKNVPRRTQSPRPKSIAEAAAPEITENAKVDFRKQHDKRVSGGRSRRQVDYDRRRANERRSFEASKLRRRRRKQEKEKPKQPIAQLTNVKLPESLTVRELAALLKKTTADVIAKLMGYGVMATVNQEIDYDTAEIIANEFDIKAEKIVEVTEEDILFDDSEDSEDDLKPRPPVVVVMGHVDHGKTSILDYIRKAKVTDDEAGGITQHIGAYTVNVDDQLVTFLDTPGHEAFTTMRARGAQVTDIAVLVVAADDGVMPQTVEAINHARAAETEIIVAINKIDKAGINIDRVKQELSQYELLSEDWGGQTTMVEVSAETGENMDELLEMITLTASVMELKANPDRQAKGTVIESKLDRGRGPVATILVQRGNLRVGDTVVVGPIIGNVRAMTNDRGDQVEEAGPSMPVEILGLPDVPESGDIFYQVDDDKVARNLASRRQVEEREAQLQKTNRMSLDNLFAQIAEGEVKDFNLIVKGDVQGSVEAVKQSLEKLSNDEVKIQVIHGAVGAITESDVRLAEVSNAVIIGFNVRPAAGVRDMADKASVDLRMYRVIYDAIHDIEDAMKGMLDPKFKEVILGHADVRETFHASGIGTIAGCYVTDGLIPRSAEVRIVRDGVVVHEGKISSLRRFKDDVREVKSGYECGIGIERYNDLKISDQIEAYEMQEIER